MRIKMGCYRQWVVTVFPCVPLPNEHKVNCMGCYCAQEADSTPIDSTTRC